MRQLLALRLCICNTALAFATELTQIKHVITDQTDAVHHVITCYASGFHHAYAVLARLL